jgi:hypothetical protein
MATMTYADFDALRRRNPAAAAAAARKAILGDLEIIANPPPSVTATLRAGELPRSEFNLMSDAERRDALKRGMKVVNVERQPQQAPAGMIPSDNGIGFVKVPGNG